MLGKGGHANSVIEVIRSLGSEALIQVPYEDVLGESPSQLSDQNTACDVSHVIAIGDVSVRKRIASSIFCQRTPPHKLVSTYAYVATDAKIGPGTVVMPSATIRSNSVIGDYSVVNTGALVDHDCRIGSFVNVSPGVVLSGNVSVEDSCVLGAGAVIIDNVSICSGVILGAGAVVLKNIDKPGTYVGVPARRI